MRKPTGLGWLAALLLSAAAGMASPPPSQPGEPIELNISGVITGDDHQRFRAIKFDVPVGTDRLEIDFSHDGQGVRTVVDLALYDPEGFRGASGSNKTSLTIGAVDATPSYLPGRIQIGTWQIVMAFPNVRSIVGLPGRGLPPTRYQVSIRLHGSDAPLPESSFVKGPLRAESAWYRGDFHSHTAHSDGSCESRLGRRVPCPSFKTLLAADRESLDFIAVTDHNTNAHFNGLRELQAYFDNILIIPGMEMTTFGGHANVLGIDQWPTFLKPDAQSADVAAVFARARLRQGLVIINHPGLPSNEDCMGCGWSGQGGWRDVDAVEVVNGGSLLRFASAEGPFSALEYWQRLLDQGLRLTAIAGSDSHDPSALPERQVPVGRPRTVVRAAQLSQRAIFDAVRAGQVFVDVDGTSTRLIDLRLVAASGQAAMGDSVSVSRGSRFSAVIDTQDLLGQRLVVIVSDSVAGRVTYEKEITEPRIEIPLSATGCERWLRADVRDQTGRLLMVTNPVYFDADNDMQRSCKSELRTL